MNKRRLAKAVLWLWGSLIALAVIYFACTDHEFAKSLATFIGVIIVVLSFAWAMVTLSE